MRGHQDLDRAAARVDERLDRVVDAVKPHLRGWLHAGWTPVVAIACTALIVLAPDGAARVSALVFGVTAVVLFGTSALYHRGTWSPRAHSILRRMDHSNIFLIIVGSYTPLSVLLLPRREATVLLVAVWSLAIAGILFKVFVTREMRWLSAPLYLGLGWAAVAYLPHFWDHGGPVVLGLVVAGGLLYTVGALVYAARWPDPSPRLFGFHEVFHAFTVVAFACHFAAIAIVVLRQPVGA